MGVGTIEGSEERLSNLNIGIDANELIYYNNYKYMVNNFIIINIFIFFYY